VFMPVPNTRKLFKALALHRTGGANLKLGISLPKTYPVLMVP
jgi:hypothetical protein